uniref:Uncharacterized protein n=1 Tax=Romanomermis culicivorax TaxID=13658 RepID=A0A915L3W1_ROMCU
MPEYPKRHIFWIKFYEQEEMNFKQKTYVHDKRKIEPSDTYWIKSLPNGKKHQSPCASCKYTFKSLSERSKDTKTISNCSPEVRAEADSDSSHSHSLSKSNDEDIDEVLICENDTKTLNPVHRCSLILKRKFAAVHWIDVDWSSSLLWTADHPLVPSTQGYIWVSASNCARNS